MKDASHGAGIVQHGVPGEWARVRGLVAPLWPLPVCAFFAGAFAATLFAGASAAFRSFAAGALIVAVLAAAWVWRRGVRRVESYFIGARGEEAVAAVMRTLPLPGHVFHDFKTPCGLRVDHLLLAPGGAFAIETKRWRGKVTEADGEILLAGVSPARDPVAQTVRQAADASAALREAGWKNEAVPVLCFASGTAEIPAGARLRGAYVVNLRDLGQWLESRPAVVAPDEIDRTAEILESKA